MTIRNLAELKRAITPETNISVVHHWQPRLVGTIRRPKAIRNCGKRGIQGNGYYFDGPAHDGSLAELFADLPKKASELRFNEDGSVTFYPDAEELNGIRHSWTLRFERAA